MTGTDNTVRSNGSYPVKVKTINGSFDFQLNRFKGVDGSTNYFSLAGFFKEEVSYYTPKLAEFVSHCATKMSYSSVSEFTLERCAGVSMSDQHIQEIVRSKAKKTGIQQTELITNSRSLASPILELSDIYNCEHKEVIWFEDGISVSQQKSKRDKIAKIGKERTTTDMILLARPNEVYECVVAAENVSLTDLAEAKLKVYYGGKSINIVVISDGSRTIKNRCNTLFPQNYTHVLDWYHLQKKVKDLMSMIAPDKSVKVEYIQELNHLLWNGKGREALEKLKHYKVKNADKCNELIGYIEKNIDHIIDYKRRKEACKVIGSGRMEKTVDQIVARRQKGKAMSWSPSGSNSLAVLTAQNRNFATENLH